MRIIKGNFIYFSFSVKQTGMGGSSFSLKAGREERRALRLSGPQAAGPTSRGKVVPRGILPFERPVLEMPEHPAPELLGLAAGERCRVGAAPLELCFPPTHPIPCKGDAG